MPRELINGCFSDWLPVHLGVPQGSVLGMLLLDKIIQTVSNSDVKLFADAIYSLEIVSSCDQNCCKNASLNFINGLSCGNFT